MASSTVDPSLPPLKATYPPSKPDISRESPQTQALISHLNLQPHIEGGYFVETDRDVRRVPNPFLDSPTSSTSSSDKDSKDSSSQTRAASTSIHYLLTPSTPLGAFHRNRGRTVHTLHKGRARYVIIHADEVASPSRPNGYNPTTSSTSDSEGDEQSFWTGGKARVETFVVGGDVIGGEKLQWIVEGGKYKASFLLEDKTEDGGKGEGTGCLISETVVPGFEYEDHDFLKRERAEVLLTKEQLEEMGWMLRVD